MKKIVYSIIVFVFLILPLVSSQEIRVNINKNVDLSLVKQFFNIREVIKHNTNSIEKYYVFDGLKGIDLDMNYLEGVKAINFVVSRHCGLYENGVINIDISPSWIRWAFTCSYDRRESFLHELKHHWCWKNYKVINYDHKGCFFNTPLDKQYGFIA